MINKALTITFILFSSVIQAQYDNCGLSEKSIALAKLIIENQDQQRSELICNKGLAAAALKKAKLMAQANKISHTINHVTANEFLKQQGIKLPLGYQILGNQVEAIQGGMENAKEAFDYFMTSNSHKEHILGENTFYQKQKHIGVGFYKDLNTKYEYYVVVYITDFLEDNTSKPLMPIKYKLKFLPPKKSKRKKLR